MKKIIALTVLLATTIAGFSQDVDNFDVGPYEVEYRGEGDFKFRLRKDVDLYKFFALQKDTVIQQIQTSEVVDQAIQVNLFLSKAVISTSENANLFGVNGSWKKQINQMAYVNAGLSLGLLYGKYGQGLTDMILEVGVPLSIEFTQLDKKKASLYGALGITPSFYSAIKSEIINPATSIKEDAKENGFTVAPRLEVGGYIPVYNYLMRIGVYGEYKIGCSGKDNVFKNRTGRAFVGAGIGLIF